jgi:hypothetical protein
VVKIEQKKIVKVDELAPLIPFKAGATFSQLWQVFYYTRLFKYVHRKHYPKIKVSYNKICTDRNLRKLCELGYFKSPQEDVYCATNKVLPILEETEEFPVEVLPKESEGIGSINELNNTGVFVEAARLETFYTLLFHDFDYIIPDALMVELDKKNRRYKLTFLEMEAQKPDWINYLEAKRDNYLKLARDFQFYKYWSSVCNTLELPEPDILDLKFSVFFICKIKRDFGPGFTFREHL